MTILVPLQVTVSTLPIISSLSPGSGTSQTTITITGLHFTGAVEVTFNGVDAVFTVNSDLSISATVPTGASSGPVVVRTAAGSSNSVFFQVTHLQVGSGSYLDWVAQSTIGTYVPSQLVFAPTYDAVTNTTYPTVYIPLYVKEHPVPIRKPKVTEVNTIPMMDPSSQYETSISVLFFGAPDILQAAISGWLITPMTVITDPASGGKMYQWNPTVDGLPNSATLGLLNYSYGDLISAYLEGRMSRNSVGRWQRQDPAYYVDPYGRYYPRAVISQWEPGVTVAAKKQDFSMTLFLETGT